MTVPQEKSSETSGETTFLTVRLEPELKDELERVARLNDRSVSGQARVFIRAALGLHAERTA